MLEVYETNRLHIRQISEMTGPAPGRGGRDAEEDWGQQGSGRGGRGLARGQN